VLEVAQENALRFGVADRYRTLPGSAFDVEFGNDYDFVLLTNFLHHFDTATCVTLLKKVYRSLKKGGKAVTLEFVPNDDRVTPPGSAAFAFMMLGTTPKGDAYTFAELKKMCSAAGFKKNTLQPVQNSMQHVVISTK
jgi:ubiquinone/menaquinone biosynthesis C-methylase UbiE